VVGLLKEIVSLFYEDKLIPKNKPYRRYVALFKITAGETDAYHYHT
jgi:hypothetical protein